MVNPFTRKSTARKAEAARRRYRVDDNARYYAFDSDLPSPTFRASDVGRLSIVSFDFSGYSLTLQDLTGVVSHVRPSESNPYPNYTIIGDDGFAYRRIPLSAITDVFGIADRSSFLTFSDDPAATESFYNEMVISELGRSPFDPKASARIVSGIGSPVSIDFLGTDGKMLLDIPGTIFAGHSDPRDPLSLLPSTVDIIDDSERRYFSGVPIKFVRFEV